jgi:Arc/MetJ-type ribon-helix-helix transcriptional regulator
MSDDQNDTVNPFIGFRIPAELHAQALRRIDGTYSSFSEYLRDLVRRDTAARREISESNPNQP